MMRRINPTTVTLMVITFLSVLMLDVAAQGATLSTACAELDRSHAARCKLERHWGARGSRGLWKLTTRLVLGEGNLDRVASVEAQFCRMVRSRGGRGQLTRWSHLPGHLEGAAKTERSCASRLSRAG